MSMPRDSTLVAMSTFCVPARYASITASRCRGCSSPVSSATVWPSFSSLRCRSEAVLRVCTKMIDWPVLMLPYRSSSTVYLLACEPQSMKSCSMAPIVSFSFSRRMVASGGGTNSSANAPTLSLYVALNSSTWQPPLASLNTRALIFSVWSSWPCVSIITSASSSTNILTFLHDSRPSLMRPLMRPGVPITSCALIGVRAFFASARASAVPRCTGTARNGGANAQNCAMRVATSAFCRASSRVGHTHSACGALSLASHTLSIDSVNAAVLCVTTNESASTKRAPRAAPCAPSSVKP
mmetsp:Transcript_3221/g.7648  ORF Transcript_3221/g.7648 Transcript_3221/m.7648 type:complete len:296 (-) Transcript_3221:95-982(-)